MYKLKYIYIYFLMILLSCQAQFDTEERFVSTKNRKDSLFIYNNGNYKRFIYNNQNIIRDSGTWFLREKRLWFNNWISHGETDNIIKTSSETSVAFSFKSNYFGKIENICFDVDNYYYYKNIAH